MQCAHICPLSDIVGCPILVLHLMLPWLSNVSLHWRIGQTGGKPSSKMESVAHWQQGSVLINATFTILSLAILWKGRVAESKSRKHAQAFRFLKSQPRLGEVGSVVSCLQCTSVLEDELAYLGARNYQRQAHRISRLLRFLGKTPSYLGKTLASPTQDLPNDLWLVYIPDQKANKSSVVADTGLVLTSVVWGENAEGNKVIEPQCSIKTIFRIVHTWIDKYFT